MQAWDKNAGMHSKRVLATSACFAACAYDEDHGFLNHLSAKMFSACFCVKCQLVHRENTAFYDGLDG